nr:PLP-dependent aminotransferase family protein [Candidatus Cryosericum odellii]
MTPSLWKSHPISEQSRLLQACRLKFCTIPLDNDGMQMDILEDKLKELQKAHIRPKFVYTVPNFHNPAGVTMTLERRKKLIELAHTYDLLIVEDDPYGEIRFEGEPIPSLLALSGKDRVVELRTFSKISFPGLRLGWVVAREDIMNKIIVGKAGGGPLFSGLDPVYIVRVCQPWLAG